MKNFLNRFLRFFLWAFGAFVVFLVLVRLLFSFSFVSQKILTYFQERLKEKTDIIVEFEQINLVGIFPYWKISKLSLKDKKFLLSAEEISLKLYPHNWFSFGKFHISSINAKGLKIEILDEEKNENVLIQEKIREFLEKENYYVISKKFLEMLPVSFGSLFLQNIYVKSGEIEVELEELYFKKGWFFLGLEVQGKRVANIRATHTYIEEFYSKLELSRSSLSLKELKGKVFSGQLSLSGNITFVPLKNLMVLESSIALEIQNFLNIFPEMAQYLKQGQVEATVKIYNSFTNPYLDLEIKANNLILEYLKAKSLYLKLATKKGKLYLENLNFLMGEEGEGKLLKGGIEIFDYEKKQWPQNPLSFSLEKIPTEDLLFVLREDLSLIQTKITGNFIARFSPELLFIDSVEVVTLENFNLIPTETVKIFENLFLKVSNFKLKANIEKEEVFLEANLEGKNTVLPLRVMAKGSSLSLTSSNFVLDFSQDLKKFLNFPVQGKLEGDLEISGVGANLALSLKKLKTQDFIFEGYEIGKLEGEASYSFLKNYLSIEGNILDKLKGTSLANVIFKGDFSKKVILDIEAKVLDASMSQIAFLMRPLSKDSLFLLDYMSAQVKGEIQAKIFVEEMKKTVVSSSFVGKGTFLGRVYPKFSLALSLKENLFKIGPIFYGSEEKNFKGVFNAFFSLNLQTNEGILKSSFSQIPLEECLFVNLPSKLKSEINGTMTGYGKITKFQIEGEAFLNNTFYQGHYYQDSSLSLKYQNEQLELQGKLLKNTFIFDSSFDLSSKEKSKLEIIAKVENLQEILKGPLKNLWGQKQANGKIFLKSENFFYWNNPLESLTSMTHIEQFSLTAPKFSFVIKESLDFYIEEGEIHSFSVNNKNKDFSLIVSGEGNLKKTYKLNIFFKGKNEFLEYIFPELKDFEGNFILQGQFENFLKQQEEEKEKEKKQTSLILKVNSPHLVFRDIPGIFSDFDLEVLLENNHLVIKNGKALFNRGLITFTGGGAFDFFNKKTLLKFPISVHNVYVPLFKKSGLKASGKLTVFGESFPLTVLGDLEVDEAKIEDEFHEMAKQSFSEFGRLYTKFIPRTEIERSKFLLYNISFGFKIPLVLKNSLANLYFTGKGLIKGDNLSPLMEGEFSLNPLESTFNFRGHEFLLESGKIQIQDTVVKRPLFIDIKSISKINSYQIMLNLFGPSDKMEIRLTSLPALSQEDILSLMAFGMTIEQTKKISSAEAANVSTVGLGSVLVDQLKLTDTLNKSLGLKFSIESEIIDKKNNLDSFKETKVSQERTSTKLILEKQVSKKIFLTFTAPLTSSTENINEFQVRYKLNNKFSLKGLLEAKENKTGASQEKASNYSLGFDFLYNHTFK